MSDKVIYVSDLDGTLLRNDGTISAYSRQKLVELIEAGVNITVASARSIPSLKHVLHDIPFRLPVIEINGAFITDFASSKHLVINDMSNDILEEVFRNITAFNCLPFISAFDGQQDRLYYQSMPNDGMEWYLQDRINCKDDRLTQIDNLRETFFDYVVAFTVINTKRQLVNLAKKMEDDFADRLEMHFFENPYSPPWYWLTIHDRKSCKSHATKELLEMTGFTMEQMVVFGDNLNDVNMFKMAHKAVAVKNASDEIRHLANEVIGTNEQDSVIKYILKQTGMPE
ncbi:MAG: Cof-type HAD-IIB family hydrolase [Planctomycetes bacterium]|nr:Cof-type HAD-IIB family hydrolase [Planctomycetota bacterium]